MKDDPNFSVSLKWSGASNMDLDGIWGMVFNILYFPPVLCCMVFADILMGGNIND